MTKGVPRNHGSRRARIEAARTLLLRALVALDDDAYEVLVERLEL